MPTLMPLERLVETRLRELLKDAGPTMDPPTRLAAVKLGIDWIRAQKRAEQEPEGSFFDAPDDEPPA